MFRKAKENTRLERNKYDDKIVEYITQGDAKNLRQVLEKRKYSSLLAADAQGRVPIYEACRLGFTECAQIVLAQEPEANIPDEQGRNPLHLASLNGHIDCVKLLCSKTSIPIDAPDHRGQTAAMHASIAGHADVLTFLLARGADGEKTDDDGNTCLLLAIRANQRASANALMNFGVNVNATNRQQKTALMFACEHGSSDVVNMLLQRGAEINNRDTGGRTALSYARINGHSKCEELLPSDAPVGNTASVDPPTSARREELVQKYPPPPSRGSSSMSLVEMREQMETLTAQLEHERQMHDASKQALETARAQLSAFSPDEHEVSFANETLDLGFDPSSPARTDGDKEVKALKQQVGTLTRAKEALAAELEAAREELTAVRATAQSDTGRSNGADDSLLSNRGDHEIDSIPLIVFEQIKAQSQKEIADLKAQVKSLQATATCAPGAEVLDDVNERVAAYRHQLLLAVQGKLAPEVKNQLLLLAQQEDADAPSSTAGLTSPMA